jgi:hypothetical protein
MVFCCSFFYSNFCFRSNCYVEEVEKRLRRGREEVEKKLEIRKETFTPIASRGKAALLMAQPCFP